MCHVRNLIIVLIAIISTTTIEKTNDYPNSVDELLKLPIDPIFIDLNISSNPKLPGFHVFYTPLESSNNQYYFNEIIPNESDSINRSSYEIKSDTGIISDSKLQTPDYEILQYKGYPPESNPDADNLKFESVQIMVNTSKSLVTPSFTGNYEVDGSNGEYLASYNK